MKKNEKAKLVKLDDIVLSRNKDGEIEPIDVYWDYVGGIVSFVPVTYGYVKKSSFTFVEPINTWTDSQKMDVVKNHCVSPDFSKCEMDDFEAMEHDTLDSLCRLIMMYSVPTFRLRRSTRPSAEMDEAGKALEALKTILTEAESNRSESGAG